MEIRLATTPTTSALTAAPELVERVRAFAQAAFSQATRRAYARQWDVFVSWCESRGLPSLPAEPSTVALFLSDKATTWKTSTLDQCLAAISQAHKAKGLPSPREDAGLRAVVRGIRRTLGNAQRRAAPLMAGELKDVLEALPMDLKGLRDRALLLVGFAGAFRRSELVALEVGDARFTHEGLELSIRRSKTDQEGQGRVVALPYSSTPALCPVRTLQAWMDAAHVTTGKLFRGVTKHGHTTGALSAQSVALIVRKAVAAMGRDAKGYSGHSLRAGFATSAARAGKQERAIMRQTGHRSVVVARRYIRDAEMWTDNAAAGLLG